MAQEDDLGPGAEESRSRSSQYDLAFEDSAIGMAIEALDGRFIAVNRALCDLVGYSRSELLTMSYMDIIHPDDLEGTEHLAGLADGTLRTYIAELRYIRSDDAEVWVRVHIGVMVDDGRDCPPSGGRATYYAVQVEDITERHLAELRFRGAFDDAAIGMALIELDRGDDVIIEVNDMASRLLDCPVSKLIGASMSTFLHPDDVVAVRRLFSDLDAGRRRQGVASVRFVAERGEVVWAHLSASAPGLPGQGPSFLVLHLQDITARKVAEEELKHQADHDSLTGLPNRHAFTRQLEAMAAATAPAPVDRRALLFIDLDRFKLVNDSLGHTVGDELLIAVAGRLRSVVPAEDMVARIGGDEFVVLARSTPTTETAERLAERVRKVLEAPFGVAGRMLFLTASVGIAVPDPDGHPEGLLPAADMAMHGAKTTGRARAVVFDPSMRQRADARLATEQGLYRALESGELEVWYQTIFSLVTARPVAAEALLRWRHPEAGLLEPDAFLDVAEETGLIVPIGHLVLSQALDQVRAWRHRGIDLVVNVNLAGAQLSNPDLVRDVDTMLGERGLDPSDLCLEVSERAVLAPGNSIAHSVTGLRRLGVAVAIDDFGMGNSSLAYLRAHPVDIVKIDGSFVAAIDTNPRDGAIVAGGIQLTHALGMTCSAEGVEKRSQLLRLADLGCDQVQGYLTARAQPVERWIADVSGSDGRIVARLMAAEPDATV